MLTGGGVVWGEKKIRDNKFSDLWIRKENYCQIITKNGELL
uniref:Uncharacterized protein n=1 Tax=Escherichia coli TaxID=562 RepID=A0A075MCA2_ECOLX|nr:hypothetical protein [Escherichia coli]